MKKMILWGASGQAKVLWEFITSQYQVIGLVDCDTSIRTPFEAVPLYHTIEELQENLRQTQQETLYFAVAIGGLYRGKERYQIHQALSAIGLHAANLIHPEAYIASNATMQAGCQIMAKAVICAEAQLGEACIVNTSATVDHESVLANGVHVCPGAHLLGDVCVEQYVTVGAGAIILPHVHIGEGAVIGAGSIVLHDVPPYVVVAGNPGKIIKYVQRG